MNKPYAIYVGHQQTSKYSFPLFNIVWKGNEKDGSTVGQNALIKMGITDLRDKEGNKLKHVPLPK